jgi:hypothetical protein
MRDPDALRLRNSARPIVGSPAGRRDRAEECAAPPPGVPLGREGHSARPVRPIGRGRRDAHALGPAFALRTQTGAITVVPSGVRRCETPPGASPRGESALPARPPSMGSRPSPTPRPRRSRESSRSVGKVGGNIDLPSRSRAARRDVPVEVGGLSVPASRPDPAGSNRSGESGAMLQARRAIGPEPSRAPRRGGLVLFPAGPARIKARGRRASAAAPIREGSSAISRATMARWVTATWATAGSAARNAPSGPRVRIGRGERHNDQRDAMDLHRPSPRGPAETRPSLPPPAASTCV